MNAKSVNKPAQRDTTLDWQSGPPPEPGWYQASVDCYIDQWRWWNGDYWSYPAHPSHNAVEANGISKIRSGYSYKEIKWLAR